MDELIRQALSDIDAIYFEGVDEETTIAALEQVKSRVDALIEDMI